MPTDPKRHSPATSIRVLIVDDHALVSEALEGFLGEEPGIAVVGRAESVAEAIRLASQRQPSVVLMDSRLPDGSGADAAVAIRDLLPKSRILFLSGDDSKEAVVAAAQAGASGFLSKSKGSSQVIDAVRRVAAGEMLISAPVLASVLGRVQARARGEAERRRLLEQLTRREREILGLMAEGRDTQDIADKLSISSTTVRTHIQHVLEKLDAHSKLEAVARAARYRLLEAG